MTVMHPSMIGIYCPEELKHMYDENAVSPGDGSPIVTEYPQYPMGAYELLASLRGNYPKHCKELQKQYPDYFEAHTKKAMGKFLNGRKVVKASSLF